MNNSVIFQDDNSFNIDDVSKLNSSISMEILHQHSVQIVDKSCTQEENV